MIFLKERKQMVKKIGFLLAGVITLALFLTNIWPSNDLLDYGEQLAGECRSCHKQNTKTDGIPPIIGMKPENFVSILMSYKEEKLTNQTMVSVAKSLDDEQMKALALYFYSLKENN